MDIAMPHLSRHMITVLCLNHLYTDNMYVDTALIDTHSLVPLVFSFVTHTHGVVESWSREREREGEKRTQIVAKAKAITEGAQVTCMPSFLPHEHLRVTTRSI